MRTDLIQADLAYIYGEDNSLELLTLIKEKIDTFWKVNGEPADKNRAVFNEKDVVLITYGDNVQEKGKVGIRTLHEFLADRVKDVISRVHILPFFPYSSDDGFSVIDYLQVADWMGDWDDVARMNEDFQLMFDMVVNHVSVKSEWFKGFLGNDARFSDYFTVVDPDTDLSAVFRPRALPLLTAFEKADGETVHVWTTFSEDQVDLNFASTRLMMEIVDVMLSYVASGAEYIRLDAIAFIWKEIGTNCLHLPKTHRIVQLMRHILDVVSPNVVIVSETNVPHAENISYFGDGHNEAQMVYNFSLPPLVLHSMQQENSKALTAWAEGLEQVSETTTFFNFLASHDGVGLMPARGLLTRDEINAMAKRVEESGGLVSYKTNSDGSLAPYELNINFLTALGETGDVKEQAQRFLASQSIMLVLQGVPGIYFHSLFGSENWREGVEETGQNRTINREKPERSRLEAELDDETHLRHYVFDGYAKMLNARQNERAFSPLAEQKILNLGEKIFAVLRGDGDDRVLCVVNVSGEPIGIKLNDELGGLTTDLLSDFNRIDNGRLSLNAYQIIWLKG